MSTSASTPGADGLVERLVPFEAGDGVRVAPLVARLTPYVDPRWGARAPAPTAKTLALLVRPTHRECRNAVCRMASFTCGTGGSTLWRHEHLDEATHDWIRGERGAVSFTCCEDAPRDTVPRVAAELER